MGKDSSAAFLLPLARPCPPPPPHTHPYRVCGSIREEREGGAQFRARAHTAGRVAVPFRVRVQLRVQARIWGYDPAPPGRGCSDPTQLARQTSSLSFSSFPPKAGSALGDWVVLAAFLRPHRLPRVLPARAFDPEIWAGPPCTLLPVHRRINHPWEEA